MPIEIKQTRFTNWAERARLRFTIDGTNVTEAVVWLVAVVLIIHALFVYSVGFNHQISDEFGFRQTQTALVVKRMLNGGPLIRYEVPIFGPPWSLVFEFPCYEWIVALTTKAGVPLIAAGRIVSIAFFVLCLIPLWKLLAIFQVERLGRLIVVILTLNCPIYLFWSRTFLIETCALSLCLWWLLLCCTAKSISNVWALLFATVLGTLAAMTKITTFLPFPLILLTYLGVRYRSRGVPLKSVAVLGGILIAIPLLGGLLWSEYGTQVNQHNLLAATFLNKRDERVWVFGTFAARFAADLWQAVDDRILPDILGLGSASFFLLALLAQAGRYARYVAAAVGLFIFTILVFPNLHRIHSYYQTENALFLTTACGLLLYGLITQGGARRIAAYSFLSILIGAQLVRYYSSYYPSQKIDNAGLLGVAHIIDRDVTPDELIVVKGEDWSSEIPFYSDRKAIMDRWFRPDQLKWQIKAASPSKVGEVVDCGASRQADIAVPAAVQLQMIQQRYGLNMTKSLDDRYCMHYFEPIQTPAAPGSRELQ